MKRETRDTVRTLAIVFAFMMAVPLSYRAWLHFHPQPVRERRPVSDFLAKKAEERAVRILRKPLLKWTDADRMAEPRIYAWLEARSKTILPWEWSEEARRKDPAGYRKSWTTLFGEQRSEMNGRLKAAQGRLKSIERELETVQTINANRTNQIARLEDFLSTNSFPVAVGVERLSKGRFWGWNTKVEEVRFERREDFDGEGGGWLAVERKAALKDEAAMDSLRAGREAVYACMAAVEELLSRIAALEDSVELKEEVCLPCMYRLVNSADSPPLALPDAEMRGM